MPKFVRPASLKFPQIYATFKAKDKDSDNQVEYVIQDLPEDYYEEALNLLVNVFLPDEALYSTRGVSADADAIKEVREFWLGKLSMKTSLACFREGSKDLAGLYVLAVYTKGDSPFEAKTAVFKDIIAAHNYVWSQRDTTAKYGTDNYLTDYGLVIAREYRQRGIAGEFLKARVSLTKLLGVKVTSSLFTAVASQKAAEKAGYKVGFEMDYQKIGSQFPAFDFSKVQATHAKILDFTV